MTPQQLNRFHTALNGLFDQANGRAVAMHLECSADIMLFPASGGAIYPGRHCGGSLCISFR